MVRAKSGPAKKRKVKRTMNAAKGYVGGRHRLRRTAMETLTRAMAFAFQGRKQKKRTFRANWITNINAAARMRGMSYNRFMEGLKKPKVDINRKSLAEIAEHDASGFDALVEIAKGGLN